MARRLLECLATPDTTLHAQVGELLQSLEEAAVDVWDAARPERPSHPWLQDIETLASALSVEAAQRLAQLILPGAPLDECAAFWMGARETLPVDDFFQACGRPRRPLSLPWRKLYGGVFRMGARSKHTDSWEQPVHTMALNPFWMMESAVTEAQLAKMDPGRTGSQLPAGEVSWLVAWLFAEWAGAALPTETQWEYACRAGSEAPWSHGYQAEDLTTVAWFNRNAGGRPQPVAQKPPNDWGMHDMHGNVMEWCSDQQRIYVTSALPQRDHGAELRSLKVAMFRVARGGYYGSDAEGCRSARRANFDLLSSFDGIGFRLVSAGPPRRCSATADEGGGAREAP